MNRQMMTFGAVLCLVAMVSFSLWPMWEWLSVKNADRALQERAKALAAKHPQLKPALNIALQDGVLTWAEVKEIVEGAGEKMPQP